MTTPITLAPKDPNERLAYTWTPQEGDTISGTPTITVASGTATVDGSVTKIDADATARFNLIGGAHGEVTKLTALATMASGDVIEQEIRIPIITSGKRCIDLAMAKQYIRYDDDDEDTSIQQCIDASQAWVEGYTGLLLTRRTVVRRFKSCSAYYDLHIGPDPVVDSVTYLDSDLAEQTVDDAEYVLVDGRLYPVSSFPYARHGLLATITAGFDGDVPADLMSAQLLMIGHLFANREAVSDKNPGEVPLAVKALCQPHCLLLV